MSEMYDDNSFGKAVAEFERLEGIADPYAVRAVLDALDTALVDVDWRDWDRNMRSMVIAKIDSDFPNLEHTGFKDKLAEIMGPKAYMINFQINYRGLEDADIDVDSFHKVCLATDMAEGFSCVLSRLEYLLNSKVQSVFEISERVTRAELKATNYNVFGSMPNADWIDAYDSMEPYACAVAHQFLEVIRAQNPRVAVSLIRAAANDDGLIRVHHPRRPWFEFGDGHNWTHSEFRDKQLYVSQMTKGDVWVQPTGSYNKLPLAVLIKEAIYALGVAERGDRVDVEVTTATEYKGMLGHLRR
jgi:hypothetical protein